MTANKCDLGGSESQITKRCTNDADRNFLGLELVAPRSSKIKTGPLESKLFRKLRNKLTPTTTPMYRYYDTSTYSIHSAGILLFTIVDQVFDKVSLVALQHSAAAGSLSIITKLTQSVSHPTSGIGYYLLHDVAFPFSP
jgi:hypothetical protein